MAKTFDMEHFEDAVISEVYVLVNGVKYPLIVEYEKESTTPATASKLNQIIDEIDTLCREGTTSKDIVIGDETEVTEDTKLFIDTGEVENLGSEVETGVNSVGSYIKFTDGTLITSHQVTRTLARTAEWGSMFETTEAANLGDYPIPFKYTPFVHVTLYSTNAICEAVQQATATSAGKMYVLGPTSNNSANYTFQVLAIGRWK